RRCVLSAGTSRSVVLAGIGRLNQSQLKLPQRGPSLDRLRRQRRNSPVRRIHDQRRATARAVEIVEDGVVGAGDVSLRSALAAAIASQKRGPLFIERRDLRVCEKFLASVPGGPLQRDLDRKSVV